MADRSFADRVVLPVTAAIYRKKKQKKKQEKPAVRWSFEMVIGDESDKMLFDFTFRVIEGFGIADRCRAKHTNRKIPVHELLLVSPTRREERLHKRRSAQASKD